MPSTQSARVARWKSTIKAQLIERAADGRPSAEKVLKPWLGKALQSSTSTAIKLTEYIFVIMMYSA